MVKVARAATLACSKREFFVAATLRRLRLGRAAGELTEPSSHLAHEVRIGRGRLSWSVVTVFGCSAAGPGPPAEIPAGHRCVHHAQRRVRA